MQALAAPPPDVTLTGALSGKDQHAYREIPFRVPRGVKRITVEIAHTGQDQKTVLDVGLRDPQRFRGWSGGNKTRFTLSEEEATPSYLPGPLPAGVWRLLLGVANIRPATKAEWIARIWFDRTSVFQGFYRRPVKTGLAWYRGDLHMHTAHSDGTCASRRGVRVPCPVFKTLEAAEARGLDFIAVTDHNTTSQDEALRELAPYFDDLLLIPGREITTYAGHANVFGPEGFIEFQLGTSRAPDFATIQAEAVKAGGLISINHPGLPSGEICMGCGWSAKADFAGVQAIEVENGGALRASHGTDALSGLAFWEARLNAGLRVTAIGGSDNHDATLPPDEPSSVGYPTTVVHAPELSEAAILAAIRAGHVFVDVTGSRDRLLEVTARDRGQEAEMGDALLAAEGSTVAVRVHVAHAQGGRLVISGDGLAARLEQPGLTRAEETREFTVVADGRAHWLRVDVRGPDGKLWLLGNPIYLNPSPAARANDKAR
ncbi:MAG: CehA/McbA family metallohydrolase [Alphaproteobacteria bacterium]|nr:CehA/McbA family metallohydrolase [Alphaproteobacteria bacterium]